MVAPVLLVTGAGASVPDGVLLQREILPRIRGSDDSQLSSTEIGVELRRFLTKCFGEMGDAEDEPSLEEVFAFLDVLIGHREDLSRQYPVARLEMIREWLIKAIHYVLHTSRTAAPSNYRRFWQVVRSTNTNISILNLNYDTALEEAFDILYPQHAVIDYCFPLMNYDEPPGMEPFNWWQNPREALGPFSQHAAVVKILKLHGSLSWQYCRSCREVLLTPWNRAIDLKTGCFVRHPNASEDPDGKLDYANTCPYCESFFETLILPPTHSKQLTHPIVSEVSRELSRELRSARRVVFIGYSFPEADVHLRVLLAKFLRTRDIVVIDPGLTSRSLARYRSIASTCRFIEQGFAETLDSGELQELLL